VSAFVLAIITPDGFDNQDVWYRVGVKTGEYTSGSDTLTLTYANGVITGVARITKFTSSTVVSAEVIEDFGQTTASDLWTEGAWSDFRGYPTAVAFYDGRLTWQGRDKFWASVSDDFESFDPETVGDSGPISRSIGGSQVDRVEWSIALQRLILGGQGAEHSVRTSSLDEPITPTNFGIKSASTKGSANVAAVKFDQNGAYVQRGGSRVYQLEFAQDGIDYTSTDLSALVPNIGKPGIVKLVFQKSAGSANPRDTV
jgi:hypothetical protein